MAIQIGRRSPAGVQEDTTTLLLECHDRIRKFTATALRLTEVSSAPSAEIAAAAAGVYRYFHDALPLHAADEDASISPRLSALDPGDDVRSALATMAKDHAGHDALLERLLARWALLAASPERLEDPDDGWRAATKRLDAELQAHLELEERVVLPAIRRLFSAEVDAEVVREMRARRVPTG